MPNPDPLISQETVERLILERLLTVNDDIRIYAPEESPPVDSDYRDDPTVPGRWCRLNEVRMIPGWSRRRRSGDAAHEIITITLTIGVATELMDPDVSGSQPLQIQRDMQLIASLLDNELLVDETSTHRVEFGAVSRDIQTVGAGHEMLRVGIITVNADCYRYQGRD